jgi:hypothetical protein
MSRSGDGSTLSLDFTAMGGTIDPRITFSRADATARATFINSLGYVTTVTNAQDPRFDFDPTTLAAKGLLLEMPATNYAKSSGTLNGNGWQILGTNPPTRTVGGGAVAPDNVTNSTKFVFGTNPLGNASRVTLDTGYVTYPYTISVWMKSNTAATNYTIWILGVSSVPVTVTPSWQRFTLTLTASANLPGYVYISNESAVATPDLSIWGVQLEGSSQASSNIATTSLAVTRAVDTAIIAAGTNFSSWYTGGTTGTFVANWYGNASSATARSVIATSDQTTKHLHMYQTASALTLRLADFNAAATVTTANSLTAGALAKGAFSYNGTATSLCLNGGTVATGTLAFSAAPTWLSIGGPSTNGTSITDTTVMLNNSIRTLKYFPARLSDGQIQGLTT